MWTPSGWSWLPVLLAAWLLYELVRALIVGAIKRRYEQQVDGFLRSQHIPTDPFRHTHRVVVKELALSDPGLAAAIDERARESGEPRGAVQAKVREWLDEIVPQFNLLAYYKVGYALGRTVAYSTYNVRLDEASLERAQAAIPEGAAVVYVSNHRSNADFVVTGFMLSKSVQISYAVGEWARVWPLENLFRSFGSYFVRRGEKDPLYHRTLEAYLQLITKQAVTQAMFPEGGLTRDGALRPVKLGLLDMMTRAKLDPAFDKPLVFVPVGINFDRVIEDENMVREAAGEARPKRSLGQKAAGAVVLLVKTLYLVPINVIRFVAKRMKKHGAVAIHFGEPVSFDAWYQDQVPFLDEADRHRRQDALRPFGESLLDDIGRNIPVTPVTWVCAALQALGQARLEAGIPRSAVLQAMRDVEQRLRAADAPFAVDAPNAEAGSQALADLEDELEAGDIRARALEHALDVLAGRAILRGHDELRTGEGRWPLVEYYANSLQSHLVDEEE